MAFLTLEEFVLTYSGKGIDYDGHYGYQCVDLYRQYVADALGFPQNIPVIGAADLWTSYQPAHYERIANTPEGVPMPGDIIVWGREFGPFGHVGVFLFGNVKRFVSFEQNFPAGSVAHLQIHNYLGVLGWLRPRHQ